MYYQSVPESDADLEQDLLQRDGDELGDLVAPQQPMPVKSNITPVEAFIMAAGKDLPALVIFCFGVTAAITGYTWLLPALNKYLSNYDATYDYDVNPYGQNMTKSDAKADAKKDANNLNNEFIEGDLTTTLIVIMSLFVGIALTSVVFNAVTLGLLHFAGIIDLEKPISEKTRRKELAKEQASLLRWNYYLDLQPEHPGRLARGMNTLRDLAQRFTPSTEYFYTPLAVGTTSALTSALILEVILGYYVQKEFNGFYDDKHDELVAGGNCESDDQALACKAQAYQYAVDSVINYLFKDVLDNSGVQALAWIPVVLLAVMPVMSFINRNSESSDRMKWISAFIKDAGQDVPYLLVLSFALQIALSGPFALNLGKEDYDADYDQLYNSGLSTSPETFAASGAANLFAGNYTYGKLLTDFIGIQTGLFALMAASVSFRSVRSIIAHRAGLINVYQTTPAEEQDLQIAQSQGDDPERMFFGPYQNIAFAGETLRGTFAHRLYTIPAALTPSSAWRVYYPMVIGVTTTLLVSAVFSIMSWVVAQDKFWKYFNEKFDPLHDNGNCETSAEDRDCRSNAARDGIIYGLNKLMSMTNKDYVRSMVWLTVGVMAAVWVANGLYNLYDFAKTPRVEAVVATAGHDGGQIYQEVGENRGPRNTNDSGEGVGLSGVVRNPLTTTGGSALYTPPSGARRPSGASDHSRVSEYSPPIYDEKEDGGLGSRSPSPTGS